MSKDYRLHVLHVLESIEELHEYAPTQEVLCNQKMAYRAALRVLQTLAESASKLPTDIQQRFPSIPWKQIYDFRNVIAHDYLDDYNQELIWNVIEKELFPLEKAMLTLLPEWKEMREERNRRQDG